MVKRELIKEISERMSITQVEAKQFVKWRDRSILGQYEGLKSESKQAFLY